MLHHCKSRYLLVKSIYIAYFLKFHSLNSEKYVFSLFLVKYISYNHFYILPV